MDFNAFLYLIGLLTVLFYMLKLAFIVYMKWIVYVVPTYPEFSRFGKWSVITGSTDGIGKCIAFELAARGQNIILIARNQEKLDNVSSEIQSKYGVDTKCLKIDFSHDNAIYGEIKAFLKGFDIGVLVNNVGRASLLLPYLELVENEPNFADNVIRINISSVVQMTEIVLPEMLKRRRGLIVNISSAAAFAPLSAMYGASKSFVHHFSQTLAHEYKNSGVIIQSCTPGFVDTNLTKTSPSISKPFFVSPESYARSLIGTFGKESWTYGCLMHGLQMWITLQIPIKVFRMQFDGIYEEQRKKYKQKTG